MQPLHRAAEPGTADGPHRDLPARVPIPVGQVPVAVFAFVITVGLVFDRFVNAS